jgi:membrane protease YdiL (CAAX protease family)
MDPTSPALELRTFLASALAIELVLLLVAGLLALGLRRRVRDPLGLAAGQRPWWHVAALVVSTLAVSHAGDALLESSGLRSDTALAEITELLAGRRGVDLALAILGLGLVPGIVEELLCRGAVMRGLASRLGPTAAIAGSALLFAALHVEPVHAGFALVLGVHLGAVALVTGSTRAAIACHVANNVLAVALSALEVETTGSVTGPLALVVAAAGWRVVLRPRH